MHWAYKHRDYILLIIIGHQQESLTTGRRQAAAHKLYSFYFLYLPYELILGQTDLTLPEYILTKINCQGYPAQVYTIIAVHHRHRPYCSYFLHAPLPFKAHICRLQICRVNIGLYSKKWSVRMLVASINKQ